MASLLELPDGVLELALSHVPQKDLTTVVPLVCKKLRDTTCTSLGLWTTVRWALDRCPSWKARLQSFVRWLVDRAAGVQRLSLRLDLPETAAAREVGWQLLLAALAAVGPTLQQLELSWPGQMEVGGWLVDLPRLTAASLDARELLFAPAAAQATSLARLSLDLPGRGRGLGFGGSAPCLPQALAALDLCGCGFRSLEEPLLAQLATLGALRSLDLSFNPRLGPADYGRALPALTRLHELGLSQASLPELPAALGVLTNLRVLYLHATLEEPPAPAALHRQFEAALGPLDRLVMLSISNNNLAELPAAVAAKTSLRVLHVEGNPLRLLPGPYLRNLEELCLEWNALFLGSALLAAAASRLSRLYLSGTHSLRDDGAAVAPPAVARALAACPALTRFVDVLEEGSGEALDVEVAQLMYLLPVACPRLCVTATANDSFGYSLDTLPTAWTA